MGLDTSYILLPPLQNLFRDKDTGLPLRNGYLLFLQDNQRTVGKEVFQITGSPPNYTYIPYGTLNTDGSWQVDLDSTGAIPFNLYWYPYDADGNVQLYFVEVYNSGGVLQFTREAEPNLADGGASPTGEVSENFVPNGQFLWHNNVPGVPPNIPNGRIQQPITYIAPGGWTFERPTGSTAQDNVTFSRFGSWSAVPSADPRYACDINCQSPDSGNAYKDLRLEFTNVNRFSSDTIYYSYGFSGVSNTGSSLTVEVLLIKNFGTGGSTTTETSLGSVTITNSIAPYFVSFIPGDNSGKTIGALDDDFIQLVIRFPVDDIFDASITDVLFSMGQFQSTSPPLFPETTDSQTAYRSVAGFLDIADYNAKDVYLPIMLTPYGLTYDTSQIGKIYISPYVGLSIGELKADGAQYPTNGYSSDGIPYSRLQEKYFNKTSSVSMPLYGTGYAFVSTYFTNLYSAGIGASLRISNNALNTAANFSDGTPATGFVFSNVTDGGVNQVSWGLYNGNNHFYIWGKNVYSLNSTGIYPGTSGFTVSVLRDTDPTISTPLTKTIFSVFTLPASSIAAGAYFIYNGFSTAFTIWFKINGAGAPPSVPGTTLIEIDLLSTWDSEEVAQVIASTISGNKVTNITCVAGSAVPPGSYWNLNTATIQYYVWYTVGGAGTDPAPSGKTAIKVAILSTDTAPQVASKTLVAINSMYFATPNLIGMTLRGTDNAGTIDTDYQTRWSFNNQTATPYSAGVGTDLTGTFEFDQITQHNHAATAASSSTSTFSQPVYEQLYESAIGVDSLYGATPPTGTQLTISTATATSVQVIYQGGSESRPLNMNVNWVIKY